ncbi:hypothetical protein [Crocinitomix algicola]|uniref:hypothetical protein n=1 Tax=Crocinitomix algicola TaxID=1740263 RepID=UPI000872ADDC|nr:hypothetical protein [Crocinitomix algicola]
MDKEIKYLIKEFEKTEPDLLELISLITEMMFLQSEEVYDVKVRYNKSYFSNYYNADVSVFNKWISLFCPNLSNKNYKSKRRFNEFEFNYIIESLGICDNRKMRPYKRSEIIAELYANTNWKASRKFHELNMELDKMYPQDLTKLRILPPRIVHELFSNYIEKNLAETVYQSQTKFTKEVKIKQLFKLMSQKKNRSPQERIKDKKLFKKEVLKFSKESGWI